MPFAIKACAVCLAISFGLSGPVVAMDYGVHGALFPVEEPSVLDAIYGRLHEMERNGELAKMEEDMKATARSRIARPLPVRGLGKAQTYRSFEIDLSIRLDRDLMDHRGVVFASAGTVVNPLDYSAFNRRLIFIDGDDPEQVAFAVDLASREASKIILTNGSPLELTEDHQILFYFDQQGIISERFSLSALPSVVSRGNGVMIVEEIPTDSTSEEQVAQ